jgi:hypothetical protein
MEQLDLFPTPTFIDRTGKTCSICMQGVWLERQFHDHMDGVLRCDNCGIAVTRYTNKD